MEQFMDNTIVSLTDFRKRKEVPKALQIETIFDASDIVLDVLEMNFEEGVAIGLLDGQLQVSSTMDDVDSIIQLLEAALDSVRNEY
jgi:hypothetical protein